MLEMRPDCERCGARPAGGRARRVHLLVRMHLLRRLRGRRSTSAAPIAAANCSSRPTRASATQLAAEHPGLDGARKAASVTTVTPRILIIAGSDSGGGAGIQADIKTVTMLGGYAMTAITAITAQNTLGVQAVMPVPAEMVLAQIDSRGRRYRRRRGEDRHDRLGRDRAGGGGAAGAARPCRSCSIR